MVVKLSATDLETGRRLAARKRGRSVVRILPEADDLVAINRITKQIRELLWRRDNPGTMRACRTLVREQARLSLAYERRHGKAPNIKHV
ncbi:MULTISPECIES: hypothetical protein [unclassified Bradyrhizobium]|uniref:hypothetical protein n=1 Tax=unclassified Bradyrhizobium TaxID=2631580 RepID=UPI001FF7D01F|nr:MULTISPECIES: hypothetical protein [unclassified Bradyrhizobium]MCK1525688.1 hypothetical protein [Bradyrhizobium sp. 17]MCK1602640.1 hypothetical protein [Bradyrhizobium sp. 166]MCK1690084.1 hypothetical protein [Bradyrhizobium sp. 145]